MASDPAIRMQVIQAAPEGQWLQAETMFELRKKLDLQHIPLGKLRRAVSSLHFAHPNDGVRVQRPRLCEVEVAGWAVRRFPSVKR